MFDDQKVITKLPGLDIFQNYNTNKIGKTITNYRITNQPLTKL